jgi:hypothetical protein
LKTGERIMQSSGIIEQVGIVPRYWITRPAMPILLRFLGKFVLDVMPAALASLVGGYLLTHYQIGFWTPRPAAVQVTPASAEMMALVRDEHAMIIDYLKSQMAAEKSRQVAADADGRDATDSQLSDVKSIDARADARLALEASARRLAATAAAKTPAPRVKSVAAPAAAPHAPLVIAQVQQNAAPEDAAAAGRSARDPDSLLAKTLDLKDHVVAATRHVVFMIGDMFASVGERIGGSAPSGRQYSSNS